MTTQKMTIQEYRASQKKKPKYGNRGCLIDGIWFQSIREGKRYEILRLMQKAGGIKDLQRQVVFKLEINGKLICKYIADFTYTRTHNGELVTEDAKGFRTETYRFKRKMMLAIYGIKIFET